MLKKLKDAKVSLLSNVKTNLSGDYAQHVELLLNKSFTVDELTKLIEPFSTLERWLFLSEIFKQKSISPVHFLHVPKTGGTTFGETLGQDKKALIISADAQSATLARQIMRLVNAPENSFVLTRAHHSLKVLDQAQCLSLFSLIISSYRDPLAVHVSNVNMIVRRLARFINKEKMPEAELAFCQEWQAALKNQFRNSQEFAIELLKSDAYAQKMGTIYHRFYNLTGWNKLIRHKKLVVIASSSFDKMFTDVFDYPSPPKRKNVSDNPILNVRDIQKENYQHLIESDQSIIQFLESNLVEPKDIKHMVLKASKNG